MGKGCLRFWLSQGISLDVTADQLEPRWRQRNVRSKRWGTHRYLSTHSLISLCNLNMVNMINTQGLNNSPWWTTGYANAPNKDISFGVMGGDVTPFGG